MYMIYRVIKDDRISLSPGDPESQAQDYGGYQGAGDQLLWQLGQRGCHCRHGQHQKKGQGMSQGQGRSFGVQNQEEDQGSG